MSTVPQTTGVPARSWRRSARWTTIIALSLILAPTLASRLLSPWRQVRIVELREIDNRIADGKRIRIASFNIAHGRGLATSNWDGGSAVERAQRLDKIAELLAEIDADVVVLNEVDFDSSWSAGVDQARWLADHCGYRYIAQQRNLDLRVLKWRWRFGNAILSKYPLTSAKVVDYPAYSVTEAWLAGKKRGLLCEIQYGERPICVAAVHLSHRDESIRQRSASLLNQLAAETTFPLVLAGDFNSTAREFPGFLMTTSGENAIVTLDQDKHFRRLPMEMGTEQATFPANDPNAVIDWIMIPRHWSFDQYQVVPTMLSDHRPVVAEITLSNTETRVIAAVD